MQAPPQTAPPAPAPAPYGGPYVGAPPPQPAPAPRPYAPPPPAAMPPVLPVLLPAVPPPRLVPRSTAELVDEGVRAVRRDIGLFAAIAAFTVVPANLLAALATVLFTPFNIFDPLTYYRVGATAAATPNSDYAAAVAGVVGLVNIAITSLGTAALITAAGLRTLGQPCTVGMAYRHARRRYWAVLVAQVVIVVAATAIAVFSVGLASPVALWLYVAWQLAPQIAVLEGKGPFAAMGRSRTLTQGGWWRLAWVLLTLFVLQLFFAAVPAGVAQLVGSFTLSDDLFGGRVGAVVVAVFGVLINVVLLPISVVVTTLTFTDQRVRREGFDVDVLLQRGAAARNLGETGK